MTLSVAGSNFTAVEKQKRHCGSRLFTLRRALAIEESINPNQRSVALTLQSLAGVYEDLGSQADAEALRLRGLAIMEKLFGRDHPEIATNLTALAANYIAQKRFAEAEPLLSRALAIREKTLGADNPETAWTLSTLGDFYSKQGRFADAEPVLAAIRAAECATSSYDGLELNIAVAYGGRQEITDAVRALLCREAEKQATLAEAIEEITPEAIAGHLYTAGLPDPDLIIRTSGEIRLSGFLLWQSAHSEFYFTDVLWPAFRKIDFLRAIRSFQQRRRRFGC